MNLEGRVAVITGGASGIGLATATEFAQAGATVVVIDENATQAKVGMDQIRSQGGVSHFFAADVSREDDVKRIATVLAQQFKSVDFLINNAAIVIAKPIEECTVAEWDRLMDVNVKSIFLMTKHLLPLLRSSSSPAIVNLGSISSFVGQKHTPFYVASKGAVAMFSKALALDFSSYGIRVNCVCPGITDTPMLRFHLSHSPDPEAMERDRKNRVPMNRFLSPNEVAKTILFLCGPDSSGITGTTLVVDAGYLAAAEWSNS